MKPLKFLIPSSSAVIGLIVVGFAAAPSAQAADRYWDTSAGAGNGVGGSGTWVKDTSMTWSTASTGDATLVTAAITDALIFQGTVGTVIMSGSSTGASLTFNTTGYTFAAAGTNLQGSVVLAAGVNLRLTTSVANSFLGFNSGTTGTSGGTGSTVTLDNNGKGALTLDLRNNSFLGATAPVTITTSGTTTSTTIANTQSGGYIYSAISNDSDTPLTLASGASASTSAALIVSGKISGTQGVNFNAMPVGTYGRIDLGAANDYEGETHFTGVAGTAKSNLAGLVRLTGDNGISTVSKVIMGYSSGKGENLDLNGKQQTFASLTSNTGGTGSIYNAAVGTSTITINGAATTGSFGLAITDGDSSTKKVALTRSGTGTTTLTNTNSYTGATNVTGGKLIINGDISTSTLTTVSGTGTLGGTGTVGAATIQSGGTLAPGVAGTNGGVGTQTFSKGLSYQTGSIFEWDLKTAAVGSAGTDFDAVALDTATGSLSVDTNATTGAIFKIVLGEEFNGAATFWSEAGPKSWNVFAATNSATLGSNVFSRFQLFDTSSPSIPVDFTSYGSFGFTNSGSTGTLTWTAVPEPTSALAGILLTVGLLRRRRN